MTRLMLTALIAKRRWMAGPSRTWAPVALLILGAIVTLARPAGSAPAGGGSARALAAAEAAPAQAPATAPALREFTLTAQEIDWEIMPGTVV